jgi:hypothetical protein|tara:strand:- start:423 stop:938 length:516 start_codon:yes stop_codon:yes gene_type:complete
MKWTFLALAIFVTLAIVANAQTNVPGWSQDGYGQDASMMDYDGVNPGKDKRCLKYEDCPEWDGNSDTKVYYDLMKLNNGTGVIAKSDFNWNVHLYSCHQNKLLDSINGEGAFERLAILSAEDGMIPCPINVNPHWSYDWESHILKAQSKQVKLLSGPTGRPSLLNSTQDVE